MDEDAIKAEMRLYALEWMVSQLAAAFYSMTSKNPHAVLEQIRQQAVAGAQNRTFSGFDAAQSDLFSAELETAVTRLLQMQKELLDSKAR